MTLYHFAREELLLMPPDQSMLLEMPEYITLPTLDIGNRESSMRVRKEEA